MKFSKWLFDYNPLRGIFGQSPIAYTAKKPYSAEEVIKNFMRQIFNFREYVGKRTVLKVDYSNQLKPKRKEDLINKERLHSHLHSKSVAEFDFSVRVRRSLQRFGVATVGELTQLTKEDLLAIRNFGPTSLIEVQARLAEFGLSLKLGPVES